MLTILPQTGWLRSVDLRLKEQFAMGNSDPDIAITIPVDF